MNRENINKIASNTEDRMLLAKLWDKIDAGIRRNIPASTGFLSLREQELSRYLFGNVEGLHYFGGTEAAERKLLYYLPDYLPEESLYDEDCPLICLRATFFEGESPNHRDFLGALMGLGITRESIGDIYVSKGFCDFFARAEIGPFLLQSFTQAGRVKLRLSQIPLNQVVPPQQECKIIRDTLASLRLDGVISSGFRISRSLAASHIAAGKAAIDGMPCEKPDRIVAEGTKISLRGLGKIKLERVNGQTKKGRISVEIHRYL